MIEKYPNYHTLNSKLKNMLFWFIVWKFQKFSAAQISREINQWHFRGFENRHWGFFRAVRNSKTAVFETLESSKLISRKMWVAGVAGKNSVEILRISKNVKNGTALQFWRRLWTWVCGRRVWKRRKRSPASVSRNFRIFQKFYVKSNAISWNQFFSSFQWRHE